MQNIINELKIARAELSAIESANKEAAIAAAFKRTASSGIKKELKIAYKKLWAIRDQVVAQRERVMTAFRDIKGEYGSRVYGESYMRYYIASDTECALLMKADEAAQVVLNILSQFEPVLQDTEVVEEKIESLEAMLPKKKYVGRKGYWATYIERTDERVASGEARMDMIRSRMAAAEGVIPGEAREWMPLDSDEAVETVAWLEAKHASARLPRRKENRRQYMTQLDLAKIDADNDWPMPKRNRNWRSNADNYWYEGYEARTRAAEAAAWER